MPTIQAALLQPKHLTFPLGKEGPEKHGVYKGNIMVFLPFLCGFFRVLKGPSLQGQLNSLNRARGEEEAC